MNCMPGSNVSPESRTSDFDLLRMPARGLDGVVDALAPRSAHADDVCLDARLRNQVLPRRVDVAGPRPLA